LAERNRGRVARPARCCWSSIEIGSETGIESGIESESGIGIDSEIDSESDTGIESDSEIESGRHR
jgi:hypothetical protein